MPAYKTNQDFYDDIDSLVLLLRSDGCINEANIIDHRLHKVAWTTSSELFGELRSIFDEMSSEDSKLSEPIKTKLRAFIAFIDKAWIDTHG